MSFEQRLYNLGKTWIELNLDASCINHTRNWLDLTENSCVKAFLCLPKDQGGLGIHCFSYIYEKLWLKKRSELKNSDHDELRLL